MPDHKFSSLKEVSQAYQLLEEFKTFILKRAEMWVAINRHKEIDGLPELAVFRSPSDWRVWVTDVFDVIHQSKLAKSVSISWVKVADDDSDSQTIDIPKSFIFAEGEELENEYETFLKLSEKFGIKID